jgi:acyl-coenzyme A thioesterase PaaI-like protein
MATINLATQFLEPVEKGLVVATARIDRLGKAVAHTTMSLHARTADGPLLATAVASYRLFHSTA